MSFGFYDLPCEGCPKNDSIRLRPNTVFDGKAKLWLNDVTTFTLNYVLPKGRSILTGSVSVLAYPADGSGGNVVGTATVTKYSGTLKGSVVLASAPAETYGIQISWVWNDGEAYTASIGVYSTSNPCIAPNTELPCLVNNFEAYLCNVDVCSLNCDNTALFIDGTVVGYFDNTGHFIVTDATYKATHNIYGYITSSSAFIGITPGVPCESSVSLVVNGETFTLDSNAPNACGYYA